MLPGIGDIVRVYNDNGHQDGVVYFLDEHAFHMEIQEDSFDANQIDETIACDVRIVEWELLYASG